MNHEMNHLVNEPYTVYVVEDNDDVLKLVLEALRFSDFAAKGFSCVEELISTCFPTGFSSFDCPDLFVLDLELGEGRKTGIDLINDLSLNDVPSEVLVISGLFPSAEIMDNLVLFGSSVFMTKPFSLFTFCEKAEDLAKVGRGRRTRRLTGDNARLSLSDKDRISRPVFLSYAENDNLTAFGIRRNLEFRNIHVWYAPTTIDTGAVWREEVGRGIDNAYIFIALLTDDYLTSPYCIGELTRFRRRLEKDTDGKLLFIPVMGTLSEESQIQNPEMKYISQTYHCIKIHPRITDGITALQLTVENAIRKKKIGARLR